MKRVFFFTGYHMEVFEFDGNTLCGSLDFRTKEADFTSFEEFLSNASPLTSYLLVDLQDEDFRLEQIPHVRGNDRKQLIQRLEEKVFRDTEYRSALTLDRLKDGRKDDQILFSSLMKVDDLNRWMTLFEKHQTPICGIWSTSFLGKRFLKKFGATEENILLLSRQMRSAVRETIFKKGQIMISRQAKLEKTAREQQSTENTSQIISSNIDVMQRFLVNQRILAFTDTLYSYSIIEDDFIKTCKEQCPDTPTLKFRFIGIDEAFKKFDVKGAEGKKADVLFSYICSLEKPSKQQYLPEHRRTPYIKRQLNQFIASFSVFGAAACILASVLIFLNAFHIQTLSKHIEKSANSLQISYDERYTQYQQKLDDAHMVSESVELAKQITADTLVAPHLVFFDLGEVLGSPRYALFSLSQFKWKKYSPTDYATLTSSYADLNSIPDPNAEFYEEYEDEGMDFRAVLLLNGHLNTRNITYSHAVALSESFTHDLEAIPSVDEVHILKNPVDIRVGSHFSDRSGQEAKNDATVTGLAPFEVRLILKTPNRTEEMVSASVH